MVQRRARSEGQATPRRPVAYEVLPSSLDPSRVDAEPSYRHNFSRVRVHAGGEFSWTEAPRHKRLPINRPGDVYEQEAERVAHSMMGSFVHPAAPAPQPAGVLLHPPASELTRGGERLPRRVADYFEARFARDFSAVRVHTGQAARHFNDAVNAYAFTYGNHIWLGPGLSAEPSHTLAHELAHVVQQTQPPRLTSAPEKPDFSRSPHQVQRFAPYWMPEEWKEVGTPTHAEVLPVIGKKYGVFTEVPVPNADKYGAAPGYEKRGGIADLYQASTFVDLYFAGHKIPKKLSSSRQLFSRFLYQGDRSAAIPQPAPQADEKNFNVIRAAQAPTEVRIGDLKPSHGTIEAQEGPGQVEGYLKGFRIAQEGVNEMDVGRGGYHQTDAKWPELHTGTFSGKVPEEFEEPLAKKQKARPLKLVHNGIRVDMPRRVMGKVYVRSDNNGIWTYTWAPTTRLTAEELPEDVTRLGADITSKVIRPLLVSPVQTAKQSRPALPSANLTPSPRQLQRQAHEEPSEDVQDSFNKASLDQWEKDHRQLTGQEEELEKTPAFKEAEFKRLVAQERQAATASNFHFAPISPKEEEAVKTTGKIRFWTRPGTGIFGKLRYYFGGLFVKVVNAYHRIRDRFKQLLHGKPSPESSGLPGTILKIVFQVLKLAGSLMVQRTAGYLIDSLKTGVVNKLKSLVPEEITGAIEEKIAQVEELASDLEARVKDTIESLVESTIGPYEGIINRVSEVAETVSKVANVVSKVRWGARVLACLSPPGWGCLWILAQPVLEKFASWLIDRCWFKKAIAPLITGVEFIASLPKKLAAFIVEKIQDFLPKNFRDVFAKIDTSKVNKEINPNEICGEDDLYHPNPYEVEKEALAELRKDIGEEKWKAFETLGDLYGVRLGEPLTEKQIEQLKKELVRADLRAMKDAAGLYGAFKPSKQVTNLTEFLAEAERTKEEMYEGGGEGAGGEGGIRVIVSAKAPGGVYKPTSGFRVVGGVTTGKYQGDIIKIDRAATFRGTTVTLEGIEVMVGKRVFIPNQTHPEKIEVPLIVTKDQYFNIEQQFGADVVNKIGYKSFEYKKGLKLVCMLNLKSGQCEQPGGGSSHAQHVSDPVLVESAGKSPRPQSQ